MHPHDVPNGEQAMQAMREKSNAILRRKAGWMRDEATRLLNEARQLDEYATFIESSRPNIEEMAWKLMNDAITERRW